MSYSSFLFIIGFLIKKISGHRKMISMEYNTHKADKKV